MGTEKNSVPVIGEGIEIDSAPAMMIESGTKLFQGDQARILIGSGVKEQLNLEIDEWVTILGTNIDGAYSASSLQVSGSFTLGFSEADDRYVMMPLAAAQQIINVDGVDKFQVTLREDVIKKEIMPDLKTEFNQQGLSVDLKSWHYFADYYHEVKGLYDMIFLFLAGIIFILVFFSILEIMSMSFFERMNEIGTVRAFGTCRSQVFSQLFQEALLIGVFGGIIGIILGLGLGHWINTAGITYQAPDMSQEVIFAVNLDPWNGIVPFLLVLFATSLSALLPAVKAARLNVVETLRHS